MPKRTRFTISLLPSDTDLMDHLEKVKKHTTLSMYVRNLIKEDLNKEAHGGADVDKLVEMVIERLKENGEFQWIVASKDDEITITDEQRAIISSLF